MVCKLRSGRRPLEIGFHLILAVPSFSNGKFHQLLLGDQDLQLIHECVLYMCMGQAVWSKVFKDPNMWAFITKIERQMCCACRSSWKLAWLNKSAKALRFPLDHSPLTTSGASRSTRLVFGRTQRISRAFAALRRSTSSGIQTDNGIWSWQLDLVASIEVVKWNGVQKKHSSKLLARVLC